MHPALKALFLSLVSAAVAVPAVATMDLAAATDAYGSLLTSYVTPAGVRYVAWRGNSADVAKLDEVVAALTASDPKPLAAGERHALYINLYNAKVLSLVIAGNPPKSIKDLSKGINPYEIFRREVLTFDGAPTTLEGLEKRLRKEAADPRVHFAVNCASRSCPPIAAEPYRGATLDAQLTASTSAFLAKPGSLVLGEGSGLFSGKTLSISCTKIFDWYSDDFAPGGGAAAFIARWAPTEISERIKAAGDKVSLDYQDYDWNLNVAP
jgi:hypothetical protein